MNKEPEQQELPFGLTSEKLTELILEEARRQGATKYIDYDGELKDL